MKPIRSQWGKGLYEIAVTLFWALAIALVFRTFLFQPFYIPSASMLPNLWVGDYVFVSKYAYGYSRFSFPLGLDWFDGRRGALDEPKRGDIAVFRLPRDDKVDYIKRIVGLPGDEIRLWGDRVIVNGVPLNLCRLREDFQTEKRLGQIKHIPKYREIMPHGEGFEANLSCATKDADFAEVVSYEILKELPPSNFDRTYQVPEGHYFMMGDNRDNSTDSRYSSIIGYIPEENLIGRAEVVFFSIDDDGSLLRFWELPAAVRWERIWTLLGNG